MKFTDAGIKALKPRAERYIEWADGTPGFGLRVSPQGRKSWVFMYRFEGRARMMTLGSFPEVGLAAARKAYGEAFEQAELGNDPAAGKVRGNKEDREAPTVATLVDEYMERWAKQRKRSWREDDRILRRDVVPEWGRRRARDITRRDVLALLDGIVERGAPIQANRTLAVVRRMFNFAIERDMVEASPCHRVKAPAKETQKDRVLATDEIRAFWSGLDHPEAEIHPLMKLALRLMLATIQRKGEVVSARWQDIDREAGVWTIPGGMAKNGQAHRVHLSRLALDILDDVERLTTEPPKGERKRLPLSEHVFHSRRTGGPLTPEAVSRAVSRNLSRFEIPAFTPHDLRRTGASHMTAMGIPRLTVSKVLNHVEKGVTAIYDRHSYDPEKRQALDAWGARLSEIVSGKKAPDNVVPLRQAEG